MEYLRQLNFISMLLRLILAVAVGGLIGLERERRSSPAGFRTYILVTVGSAMTTLISQYLDAMLATQWLDVAKTVGARMDVARFGAQVISGVGFLGAGSIILTDHRRVKGLTTAAGLWTSACLGLTIGAGYYECVLVSTVLIWICLRVLPVFENRLIQRSRYMNIYAEFKRPDTTSRILKALLDLDVKVLDIDLTRNTDNTRAAFSARLTLYLPRRSFHADIIAALSALDSIVSIEESQ